MIEKALRYIVGLNKPEILEIGGQTWSDKELERVSHNPKASDIKMSTLTSLIDYIKAGIDSMPDRMIIHVVSPREVRLVSMLDDDRMREELVRVSVDVPDFNFGAYMNREVFNIALQSVFAPGDDRDKLLRFVGTVKNSSVSEYGDDDVSQKATIRKGVAGYEDALVPNPVKLRPYRTFLEVEQPESAFVFRMKEAGETIQCAVFEADGGAWRNAAMKAVKEYLQYELAGMEQFTVIS